MKIKMSQLEQIVASATRRFLSEAGKKKPKAKKETPDFPEKPRKVLPKEYLAGDALDMSKPLGKKNLYKRQGASNLGPYTAEASIRSLVSKIIVAEVRRWKKEKSAK